MVLQHESTWSNCITCSFTSLTNVCSHAPRTSKRCQERMLACTTHKVIALHLPQTPADNACRHTHTKSIRDKRPHVHGVHTSEEQGDACVQGPLLPTMPRLSRHLARFRHVSYLTLVERACSYEMEGWLDTRCQESELAAIAAAVAVEREGWLRAAAQACAARGLRTDV
jgi:hypothetical protein